MRPIQEFYDLQSEPDEADAINWLCEEITSAIEQNRMHEIDAFYEQVSLEKLEVSSMIGLVRFPFLGRRFLKNWTRTRDLISNSLRERGYKQNLLGGLYYNE